MSIKKNKILIFKRDFFLPQLTNYISIVGKVVLEYIGIFALSQSDAKMNECLSCIPFLSISLRFLY